MARHPSILILFLGGSTLDERLRRGSVVAKATDIDGWLSQMGEMGVIASTAGVFIHDGVSALGMNDWARAAVEIKQHYARVDGFVVVHQAATVPSAAVAFALMLEPVGKPVVLVSSPLLSPAEAKAGWTPVSMPDVSRLGAKANFINALQVAVSDLGAVVVAIGHRLYRARTFIGPLAEPRAELIGKIDFGVRFFGHPRKRQAGPIRIKPDFAAQVAIVEYLPGLDARYIARLAAGSQGMFLSIPGGVSIPTDIINTISTASKHLPILLNGQSSGRTPTNVVAVPGDRATLLVRWMWALGQSKQPSVLRKLMLT